MIGILLAAQLVVVAHAADTVGACEPLDLSVAVSAAGTTLPHLVTPALAPFDVMRTVTMPQVEHDSRAYPSVMVESRYTLVASEPGTFVIPAFEARLGSASARSAPLRVVVTPTGGGGEPAVLTRAQIDTGNEIGLRAGAPDTVYVGQQADYTVAVFLNAAMRNRLRRNPTFYPPDMQSVLAYDLPGGGSQRTSATVSRCFDALVYRRALFPLEAGRIVVPPAQLTYSLPVGVSFFSREESHDLQTDSAVVVAIDPPVSGRPADFDGAVGRLQLDLRVQSPTARVGDPVTVTLRVSGTGNIKLMPRPRFQVPGVTLIPSDERVHVDSSGRRIGGSKEFDWILTPRVAGELDLRPVRYSYFDPDARRYETAMSAAARVNVAPGALAALDTTRTRDTLSLRTVFRGPIGAPLSSYPVFWWLLTLAPIPALGARWRGRRRQTRERDLPARARLDRAAHLPAPSDDGRALRHAFVAALADRVGLDAETFTSAGGLRRALRRAGAPTDVADAAEALLRELDVAAFSPVGTLATDAGERALEIVRRIEADALPRRELPFRSGVLIVLVAVGLAGTLRAIQSGNADQDFRSGVTAYAHRDFPAARDAFGRVVAAEPRAADGWANFGTAAWAARDTVRAVVGWRRALDLEPLASDARDRLAMVHGMPAWSPGYVPPVPLNALLILLAGCWLMACAAWHPRLRRRQRWLRALPAPLAAGAGVLGLCAIAVAGPLDARGLAVVRGDATLRNDPAFGADRGAEVVTGETARVLTQQGAWLRVALDGGRQGWLPAQQLVALDAPVPSSLD
jgi:BatD DUF11 like domain